MGHPPLLPSGHPAAARARAARVLTICNGSDARYAPQESGKERLCGRDAGGVTGRPAQEGEFARHPVARPLRCAGGPSAVSPSLAPRPFAHPLTRSSTHRSSAHSLTRSLAQCRLAALPPALARGVCTSPSRSGPRRHCTGKGAQCQPHPVVNRSASSRGAAKAVNAERTSFRQAHSRSRIGLACWLVVCASRPRSRSRARTSLGFGGITALAAFTEQIAPALRVGKRIL